MQELGSQGALLADARWQQNQAIESLRAEKAVARALRDKLESGMAEARCLEAATQAERSVRSKGQRYL